MTATGNEPEPGVLTEPAAESSNGHSNGSHAPHVPPADVAVDGVDSPVGDPTPTPAEDLAGGPTSVSADSDPVSPAPFEPESGDLLVTAGDPVVVEDVVVLEEPARVAEALAGDDPVVGDDAVVFDDPVVAEKAWSVEPEGVPSVEPLLPAEADGPVVFDDPVATDAGWSAGAGSVPAVEPLQPAYVDGELAGDDPVVADEVWSVEPEGVPPVERLESVSVDGELAGDDAVVAGEAWSVEAGSVTPIEPLESVSVDGELAGDDAVAGDEAWSVEADTVTPIEAVQLPPFNWAAADSVAAAYQDSPAEPEPIEADAAPPADVPPTEAEASADPYDWQQGYAEEPGDADPSAPSAALPVVTPDDAWPEPLDDAAAPSDEDFPSSPESEPQAVESEPAADSSEPAIEEIPEKSALSLRLSTAAGDFLEMLGSKFEGKRSAPATDGPAPADSRQDPFATAAVAPVVEQPGDQRTISAPDASLATAALPAVVEAPPSPVRPLPTQPAPAEPGRSTTPALRPRTRPAPPRRARRVTRIVRQVDPWSVLKISLVFYFCVFVVFLVAGTVLWQVAQRNGLIHNVEKFFEDIGFFENFTFNGGVIFKTCLFGGIILVVAGALFNVLLSVLFNLISDVFGGIRFDVLEENDPPAARPRKTAPMIRSGPTD